MLGKYELAASSGSGGFNPSTLILILIVVVAFYFLMIRPQQRRKAAAAQQKNTLAPGSEVRTTAGMYATVVEIDGDDVVLEVADGVQMRFLKRAIMDVITSGDTLMEEYEGTEGEDGDAEDTDDADDADDTVADPDDSVGTEESEEIAYEQATGTKKD